MRIYYPDVPPLPLPLGHRFPACKYELLHVAVVTRNILRPDELIGSPTASRDELILVHDSAYVDAVVTGSLSHAQQRAIGLPWSQILVDRSRATVGGTLAAGRTALETGISGQLAGGTHHAHRAHGAGFCVFNDCAVAAFALLAERAVSRVGVLDLDVHQGDGNAAIMGPDPRIFVASVHGTNNYPPFKPPSDLDIGLPDGDGDDAYLAACQIALAAVVAFRPEVVFYIAGVDPMATDRLGRLAVSHDGLARRDHIVLSACRRRALPVVLLIGGGYAEPITDTVDAYAATFAAARAIYG